MRINKYIAQAGIASRRKADELVVEGRVKVNGDVVRELGVQIDPARDVVEVDGKKAQGIVVDKSYYAVYKPQGYVSTTTDRFGEKTVLSLVPTKERLFIVGRLDKDSEGLMILTNDGDFAYAMMHPKHEVAKTYHVLVRGRINDGVLDHLRTGIELDDGKTASCEVRVLRPEQADYWLEFVLHEGKKRQIRRMCAEEHLFVKQLIRVKIGLVELDGLKSGGFRKLDKGDLSIISPES